MYDKENCQLNIPRTSFPVARKDENNSLKDKSCQQDQICEINRSLASSAMSSNNSKKKKKKKLSIICSDNNENNKVKNVFDTNQESHRQTSSLNNSGPSGPQLTRSKSESSFASLNRNIKSQDTLCDSVTLARKKYGRQNKSYSTEDLILNEALRKKLATRNQLLQQLVQTPTRNQLTVPGGGQSCIVRQLPRPTDLNIGQAGILLKSGRRNFSYGEQTSKKFADRKNPHLVMTDLSPQSSKNLLQQLEKIKEESEASETDPDDGIQMQKPLRAHRSATSRATRKKEIRWLSVGPHDHDISAQTVSASDRASPHLHSFRGSSVTPHIIVSVDDGDPQPLYQGADYSDDNNKDSPTDNSWHLSFGEKPSEGATQEQQPQEQEANSPDNVEQVENAEAKSPSDEGGCPDVNVQFQNLKKSLKTLTQLENRNFFGGSSNTSSGNNSPTDDQLQTYFPTQAVEENRFQEYQNRFSHQSQQRYDSNNFRSISMASLELMDPFMRKTRRSLMLDMMRRMSSQSSINLQGLASSQQKFLNLQGLAASPMGRSTSRISLLTQSVNWKVEMNEALILCISALYGKLLVVMGMAFPVAEVFSEDAPQLFFYSFYLYLYFGSILFLIYTYLFLLREKSIGNGAFVSKFHSLKRRMPDFDFKWPQTLLANRKVLPAQKEPTVEKQAEKDERISVTASTYKPPKYTITESSNHGSMYLKMGAVVFGIGSMIYSGLEFGQYFELRSGPICGNILMAVTPVARMIFTFLQMYFIFINSRVAISKHTIVARFGLMHMIGTNLCIWINVLVQETKTEIAHLLLENRPHNVSQSIATDHHHLATTMSSLTNHHEDYHADPHHFVDESEPLGAIDKLHNMRSQSHGIMKRMVPVEDELSDCRRINLMGNVVKSASPFLFPCTIEYSLLCAGVLYVMWKNISTTKVEKAAVDGDSDISNIFARKVRHHYSVDCARASRGLFMGIFVLVLTIISLILFYVLVNNQQFLEIAILEANIVELSIYSGAVISVIYGMKQMRELEFMADRDIELDNILLIAAQAGVYIYTSFTIIGGYFHIQTITILPLLTSLVTLIQTTLQTLFILDGSRRCCFTADQLDRKPGREMVTFLLVCNLAMWAISTFETSRAEVHPTQLHFYGIWAWTIISHVSMPLAIFYRFHVTVCLGEIWKRAYKMKQEFMGIS